MDEQLRMGGRDKKQGAEELETKQISLCWMMFLCVCIAHPNPIESRKLKDGDNGLEQDNRSYALDWTTKVNWRNGLSSDSLQVTNQFDSSDIG